MKMIRKAAEVRVLEQRADANGHRLAVLMDRAGTRSAEWLMAHARVDGGVLILCGKGNNGGDGYVAAEVLRRHGHRVALLQVDGAPATDLAKHAAARAEAAGAEYVTPENIRPEAYTCVVDAVYGIGFRGGLRPAPAELFERVNQWPVHRVALDLPSGTVCDTCEADPRTFRADDTLSFMCLKPVHVHAPSDACCGQVHHISLGIPAELEADLPEYARLLEAADIAALLPPRNAESNKGTYGKALCVCGSWGMAGAAALAASGALKSGCGLVQLAVPEEIYPILAGALWEPVYLPLKSGNGHFTVEHLPTLRQAASGAAALLIGCGMGLSDDTAAVTMNLLAEVEKPMVVDADGINCISRHKMKLQKRTAPWILTPHPGEMARLTGKSVQEIQRSRVDIARAAAKEQNAVMVLKGHHTVIAAPDGRVWINPTGNDGMAKGGSGDLLAGMLVSLLAQGMDPAAAACAAVYLHGLAGDLCRAELSPRAMQPRDAAEKLSAAFAMLGKEASC